MSSTKGVVLLLVPALLFGAVGRCGGGTGAENPASGNITLTSAPFAGPDAGALGRPKATMLAQGLAHGLTDTLFGIEKAWAAVPAFSVFRACNDTLKFIDGSGNTIQINGTDSPEIGQGLLDFSPTSTVGKTLGTLTIPPGTTIREINITFAVVPSVCSGANYAIEFDNGTGGGLRTITQNTAFKFLFSPTYTVPSSATITLLFGQIVNGMAALGNGLNNSTIQTVNVGQAR